VPETQISRYQPEIGNLGSEVSMLSVGSFPVPSMENILRALQARDSPAQSIIALMENDMAKQSSVALVDQIKLVSIDPVMLTGFPVGTKVTLTCDQTHPTGGSPIRTGEGLTATFTYKIDQVTDDRIVSVARADFHELVRDLATATKAWALTTEQRNAFETPNARKERELNEQGLSVKLRATS
jgi:hypothetical protein